MVLNLLLVLSPFLYMYIYVFIYMSVRECVCVCVCVYILLLLNFRKKIFSIKKVLSIKTERTILNLIRCLYFSKTAFPFIFHHLVKST